MSDEVARYTCSLKILEERGKDFPWEIRVHPEMGRSCFATRTIEAGETLAYDEPLLYWEEEEPIDSVYSRQIIAACGGQVHNNVVNYLAAYASSSEETQSRIADFMHVTTAQEGRWIADMTKVWTRIADDIWSSSSSPSADLHHRLESRENIVNLLTKSHLNAHNFATGHVMLEIGSKFNHSCAPNATYNKFLDPRTNKSLMRIFSIRRILAGEQIFSTYIGGTDMLESTRQRRARLSAAKAFRCTCTRCTRPELFAPLPCPSCTGTALRHDVPEWPWHCLDCGRRWWDAQVTAREGQLLRLLTTLDRDLNFGRLPPLQIMYLLLRDTLTDLKPGHYLAIRARLLLDELYAFREVTGLYEANEEGARRVGNAWTYVEFLMTRVWHRVSPVVATNLAILRLRTLLGREGHFPPGVPREQLSQVLRKSERFLRSFWGEDDADAALFRNALAHERICRSCQVEWVTLVVCGSCASAHYCSRTCQVKDKESHAEACLMGQEVGNILHSDLAF